ncbi:hypothetical protein RG47T_1677 [Mucilaginibacter polytrichastri]|uniref:Uncharacterized protein n=2 Tax=Mucilaginibacter polytrichastri TaxID=1302689 RepID=A0A1Q5ZWU9_9SPHI|nr:hypothetical protein RG47T_1677 [Mucilaginibacter polytrichastri]SFT16082.1 hypothetical protein SAMN04487890_11386 [Mucilaginibacter polytrichastri]
MRRERLLIKKAQMNYPLIGLIIVVAIAIVIVLIKRNRKDQKEFEHELDKTEIHPGTDDEPKAL